MVLGLILRTVGSIPIRFRQIRRVSKRSEDSPENSEASSRSALVRDKRFDG